MNDIRNKLSCIKGDITVMDTDAIVNAANTSLLGGGGVDGAIHRAAGPELLRECRAIGGCPTGEARLTKGYNLKARYVIHTVGPVYSGTPKDAQLLGSCYRNSLDIAVSNNIKSLSFPAISCGVYGYPIAEASRIAIRTVQDFLSSHLSIEQVVFVLFSKEYLDHYVEIIG
ncbi:MAG: O-acetyl-ADP-ribose deacetylase [Desulfobacteraceae bacterium]|jgi:O-acetyl-ADP-ribose deacetylase (regulator of RNase III)